MYLFDFEVKTAPVKEPVSLSETKDFCRIAHSKDDNHISDLIAAARKATERALDRALITQTVKATFKGNDGRIEFPFAPLQGGDVTSITELYWDSSENTAIDASAYRIIGTNTPTLFVSFTDLLRTGVDYGYDRFIEIEAKVGYGDNPTDVPQPIREFIKRMVYEFYYNRTDILVSGVESIDVKTIESGQSLILNYKNAKAKL